MPVVRVVTFQKERNSLRNQTKFPLQLRLKPIKIDGLAKGKIILEKMFKIFKTKIQTNLNEILRLMKKMTT